MTPREAALSITEDAMSLLSDESKWARGSFAYNSDGMPVPAGHGTAVCWCLAGAGLRVAGEGGGPVGLDAVPAGNWWIRALTRQLDAEDWRWPNEALVSVQTPNGVRTIGIHPNLRGAKCDVAGSFNDLIAPDYRSVIEFLGRMRQGLIEGSFL